MTLFIIVGSALFVLGLLGVLIRKEFLRKLISLNIFTAGIFLIFVSTSMRENTADSVVSALVLTGLVVTLGASAFALMLLRTYAKKSSSKGRDV